MILKGNWMVYLAFILHSVWSSSSEHAKSPEIIEDLQQTGSVADFISRPSLQEVQDLDNSAKASLDITSTRTTFILHDKYTCRYHLTYEIAAFVWLPGWHLLPATSSNCLPNNWVRSLSNNPMSDVYDATADIYLLPVRITASILFSFLYLQVMR